MEFKIGKTKVGGNNPCFISVDIGINHDGKFEQALQLVDVAVAAGVNGIKFQMFRAKKMYVEGAGNYTTAIGEKRGIIKIVREHELPEAWLPKLKKYIEGKGLEFFVTACDERSADILEKYNVSAYKLASYAITHTPLIKHIANKKRPLIFSCGGATLSEVGEALRVMNDAGQKKILLMHCMGKYPVKPGDANINIVKTLTLAFPDIVIGYSDHTENPISAPVAAVTLGAKMIEKHITINRKLPGPDHTFALEPKELKQMVFAIRNAEKKLRTGKNIKSDSKLLGSSERRTYPVEKYVREFAYRGWFATKRIKKGEKLTKGNTAVLRPGEKKVGIHPRYSDLLKGARAIKAIPAGTGVQWNHLLQK